MTSVDELFYDQVLNTSGDYDGTHNIEVLCLSTNEFLCIDLISMYKTRSHSLKPNDTRDCMMYLLICEKDNHTFTMVVWAIYDRDIKKLTYTMKDENGLDYVIIRV